MQVPFPELTFLWLGGALELGLPGSLLGGSAPRLENLRLQCPSYRVHFIRRDGYLPLNVVQPGIPLS